MQGAVTKARDVAPVGPSTKARDVVCNGCGGVGGRHIDPRCPFLIAAVERNIRQAPKRRKGGSK